jgi:hypothetical protein
MFILQRHYGHKQKGTDKTWRGNANGENSGSPEQIISSSPRDP